MTPIDVEATCPDDGSAQAIAEAAVAEGLAACAWVIPGVRSVSRWQGTVGTAAEVSLDLRTRADLFDPLCVLIRAHHPYDLPAIAVLAVAALGPGMADWWRAETGASPWHAPA